MSIFANLVPEIKVIGMEDVYEAADIIKEELLSEAENALAGYYSSIGPGTMYVRTDQFDRSFTEIDERSDSAVVVGVDFNQTPSYPIHARSVDSEMIYDWDIEGWHGSLGNSGPIDEDLNLFAEYLSNTII